MLGSKERVFNIFQGKNTDHLPLMPITMQLACDLVNRKYYDYAKDYNVLVEGQLAVVEEFEFDHVSCISDPGREAADCGASIVFKPDSPPAIDNQSPLLADKTKLAGLVIPDVLGGGRMHDRVKAAALFKQKLGNDKIIEGWVEGPCAEGADLRGISGTKNIMMDFYEDPGFVHDLFEFCTEMGLLFAKYQIEAGVDIIGVGDAAASLIGPKLYDEFVFPYEKKLIDGIHDMGSRVRLHICGNITDLLGSIKNLGCEMIDVDYPVDILFAREKLGPEQVIAGNLNPVAVLQDSTPKQIYEVLEECHHQAGNNYIVAAGCEIPRGTPNENVRVLTDYAKSH